MRKRLISVLLAVAIMLNMTLTAFAGNWGTDENGWWWLNDDGTYPTNCWQWCDGNGDGVAECYYFDGNGYCLMNGTTPDGYQVDDSGRWVVDGVVQTQGTDTSVSSDTSSDTTSTLAALLLLAALGGGSNSSSTSNSSTTSNHTGKVSGTKYYSFVHFKGQDANSGVNIFYGPYSYNKTLNKMLDTYGLTRDDVEIQSGVTNPNAPNFEY